MEVQRMIAADAGVIFRVLSDPQGHVAIDSSGMLMEASGVPVTSAGAARHPGHPGPDITAQRRQLTSPQLTPPQLTPR